MKDYKRGDYSIALQQAIEYHCKGKLIPNWLIENCGDHAEMLNCHLTNQSNRRDKLCTPYI